MVDSELEPLGDIAQIFRGMPSRLRRPKDTGRVWDVRIVGQRHITADSLDLTAVFNEPPTHLDDRPSMRRFALRFGDLLVGRTNPEPAVALVSNELENVVAGPTVVIVRPSTPYLGAALFATWTAGPHAKEALQMAMVKRGGQVWLQEPLLAHIPVPSWRAEHLQEVGGEVLTIESEYAQELGAARVRRTDALRDADRTLAHLAPTPRPTGLSEDPRANEEFRKELSRLLERYSESASAADKLAREFGIPGPDS